MYEQTVIKNQSALNVLEEVAAAKRIVEYCKGNKLYHTSHADKIAGKRYTITYTKYGLKHNVEIYDAKL